MTPSLGLVFALLFLAPGLAFYGGLFLRPRSRHFQPTPPAPGSVLSLGIVAAGVLGIHAAWATLSALDTELCARVGCLALPFETNIYAIALSAGVLHQSVGAAEIAIFLVITLALSLAAYLAGRAAARLPAVNTALYGWLDQLVEASLDPTRVMTAFVLTQSRHDGLALGYKGLVVHIALDGDRQISALALADCTPFTVLFDKDGVQSNHFPAKDPIPLLYIERAQIENLAFEVLGIRTAPLP